MRRLPIFFLLDISESMIGENISSLEHGVEEIVQSLRQDAHALETVHISVLAFAGRAGRISPLTDLISFYPPRLPVGSGTSMGAALECLMSEIDEKVKRRTENQRGDYKPVVYLMTDGRPTDTYKDAITKWKEKYSKRATMVAIAIGGTADTAPLAELTDNVIVFDQRQPGDLDKLIRWVTASISIQSQSVDSAGVNLAKPEGGLSFLDSAINKTDVDGEAVLIPGMCQMTMNRYLIKYIPAERAVPDLPEEARGLGLLISQGTYAIDSTYDQWSDPSLASPTVNSNLLRGGAVCPHCNAPHAMAMCDCGGVHCVQGDGEATCPHCDKTAMYGTADGNGPGQNLERGRG